ncbi:MAG: hypothetical protein KA175_09705 [Flavobacteriales bacterium]|nr:hypothetical protein [Flavobacteriales bacterium]MBP6697882.1 hypothetical protein [Flavobacteriales bacterium]
MRPSTYRVRVLLFLVLVWLLPYVYLAFHVHPFGDDWSYAVLGRWYALWPRLLQEYRDINGRFSSNVLLLCHPMALGLRSGLLVYRTAPVLLLLLLLAGSYALLRAGFRGAMGRSEASLAAAVLVVLFVHGLPDLSEGLYWYTGAVTYLLPCAASLFVCAAVMILRMTNGQRWRRPLFALAAVLLVFIALSCELHMVLAIMFAATFLYACSVRSRKLEAVPVILLLIAMGCGVLMFLAPGNLIRELNYPQRGEVLRTAVYGALQSFRFIVVWVASPLLLPISVLWVEVDRRYDILGQVVPYGGKLLLGSVVVVFVAMALPYWTTGTLGQHRTVNVAWFCFLPAYAVLIALGYRKAFGEAGWPWIQRAFVKRVALIAALIALFFTGNTGRVWRDIGSGRAGAYDVAMHQRYALVTSAIRSGRDTLVLAPPARMPASLRILDAGPDPEHWANRYLVRYFGGEEMRFIVRDLDPTVVP